MHELSIASSVVSTVTQALGERRVLRVQLRIGPLAGVVPDSLRFCWDVVTAGTPLAGATLDVVAVPLQAQCTVCQTRSEHTTPPPLRCPSCEGTCLPLEDGRTLEVGEVEVADDEEDDPALAHDAVGHDVVARDVIGCDAGAVDDEVVVR